MRHRPRKERRLLQVLQTQKPSGALRAVVRTYAQRDVEASDAAFRQVGPARLEPTLEFQFHGAFDVRRPDGLVNAAPSLVVVGGYSEPVELISRGRIQTFAVFFQPTGFSRLFGIGNRELFNRFHDAHAVLGSQIEALRCQLAETESFDKRARITDAFLCKQLSRARRAESMWQIADHMFEEKGVLRMHDVAYLQGMGMRQFERTFQQQIGTTPKQFARIARFTSALDAKAASPHRPWLYIAHTFGYYDQMHMVRDFHELAGCAPGTMLANIGDSRPPSQLLVSV